MILLQQMLALFIMMMLGYFCGKIGVLDKNTTKKISWLVLNIANVAMILQSGLSNDNDISMQNLAIVIGIAAVLYAVLLLLAWILPIMLRVPKEEYGCYRAMLVFSNIGFMGLPLLSAIAAKEAILYAAMFLFIFNVLIYTYGIYVMGSGSGERQSFQWKKLINPGVVSCVITLIFFLTKIDLPDFADTVLGSLSGLTGPLSMLVIGQSFTEFRISDLFKDVKLLLFSAIKLLAIPILGLFLIKCFVTDVTILNVCLVMLSAPVASMVAMMAQQYNGNAGLVSKGVALTTLLSVATMPFVSMVAGI